MRSLQRRITATLTPALVLAGALLTSGSAAARTTSCSSPIVTGDTVLCGSLADGATYLIEFPPHWNKTLFLYSHGYVAPTQPNPAQDVGDPVTGRWLLTHGYAIAGSSYSTTGWSIAQALPDQIKTLEVFRHLVGHPKRVIAWGHSLGGIITAGLIQRYPHTFSGALPMCGVLAGGVATWNTALDGAFAFKVLIDHSAQVVHITNALGNLNGAEAAAASAQSSAKGRARLALTAALGDVPGWFTPLSKPPAATNYAAQERNQFQWFSQVDGPFIFALRAELEARAGGNPSWTTGVNFARQLARSPDRNEVAALYKTSGLSLKAALARLNRAHQIAADPAAVRYLKRFISFTGRINIPVLSMHTTGDGLVIPENEQAYASVVNRAGRSFLLRQVFVRRAGHCAFTPAETVTAVKVLLHRMRTGLWGKGAVRPSRLNAAAKALGPGLNIFFSNGHIVPVNPAFLRYSPPRYPRPFDLP